jgi:isopenicillin N synthase-like dioxygenase
MFNEPAYQAGTVAHMESFDCGREHIDGSANPIWPGLATFESDAKRCWQDLTAIGNATLRALARAVGMDATFLVDNCSSKELDTLRLLHYPQNDAPACERNVGISAHTDFECMTLIYQSSPGLELTDPNGDWFDAPSHDGRLVVLIDDMLERWTNGELQATGHRVRNTPEQRFSIVMFFAVNPGIEVAPLPCFVGEGRPARYEATTQEANIEQEMNSAQDNLAAMAGKD